MSKQRNEICRNGKERVVEGSTRIWGQQIPETGEKKWAVADSPYIIKVGKNPIKVTPHGGYRDTSSPRKHMGNTPSDAVRTENN